MPWVDARKCNGCGACVDVCPAGAISIFNSRAFINMAECLFCLDCMQACTLDAVRRDGEKIAAAVAENLERAGEVIGACAAKFEEVSKRGCCSAALKEYFRMQETVAARTLAKIEEMEKSLL